MKIEIFTVCEFAQTIGDIINVLSPFDTIFCEKLPVVKSLSIALRIRYKPVEKETKIITYKVLNPDGENIIDDIRAVVEINPVENKSMCVNLVVNFEGLKCEKIGKYTIEIESEGETHEVPLYVVVKN